MIQIVYTHEIPDPTLGWRALLLKRADSEFDLLGGSNLGSIPSDKWVMASGPMLWKMNDNSTRFRTFEASFVDWGKDDPYALVIYSPGISHNQSIVVAAIRDTNASRPLFEKSPPKEEHLDPLSDNPYLIKVQWSDSDGLRAYDTESTTFSEVTQPDWLLRGSLP